ncbi:hypothetical protein [Nitrosophilus labii]|uniref:hypothetical protein n=1 Tax=Nitrosophilus labii TaxID=2706014 RepID=UPI0016574273|nr:hypothetical protein [Nitrosophilus labii]
MNKILKEQFLPNITLFKIHDLEYLFDEIRKPSKIDYFNEKSEEILIDIIKAKEWNIDEKIEWCNFIQYLFEKNKIKTDFLIRKFAEKEIININGNWIDCNFLKKLKIKEDEIPF